MGRRLGLCLALLLTLGCRLGAEPERAAHLTFLQFNDHYILEPTADGRGGMARIATLVARVRRESPHTLLALAGDTLSPSLLSGFLRGEQMVEAWNLLGLDVATFGNHEFDFGPAVLEARMAASRFVWLSANVLDRRTWRPFGGARPWLFRELDGIPVGLFGLTMPETRAVSSPGPGVEFLPTLEAAQEMAPTLRASGARLVVAVTHQAMAQDQALARAVPADLILGGHEHEPLEAVVGPTLITKAGSDGVFVVRVDYRLTRSGQLLGRRHRFIPVTAEIPEDPAMAALVARYQERLARELEVVIGETRVPLEARGEALRTRETNLGDFVADASRARLGADVGLMNGGGIRTDLIIPPGPLNRKTIHSLLPFANVLVKLEVPGETLLAALEHAVSAFPRPSGRFLQVSGLTFAFDPARPAGERVRAVAVGGRPLDPRARYTVALNDYLARGGDGYTMFRGARVLVGPEEGPSLAGAVMEAVERERVIAPRAEGRIRLMP